VVDTDERRRSFGEPLNQPPGNAPARPILPRTGWRLDFPLNPAENPGSRTNVLAIGVTYIKPTAEGFIIVARRIEIAPAATAGKTTAAPHHLEDDNEERWV
jgi:hypothetical protein